MKAISQIQARKAYKEYQVIQANLKKDISRSKVEWNAHARKVTLLTEALRFNKTYLRDTITDKAAEIYDKWEWQKKCHRLSERIRLIRRELKREIEECKTSKQLYKIYCAQQAHLYPTAKSFRAVEEGEKIAKTVNPWPPKEVPDKVLEERNRRDAIFNAMQIMVDTLEGIKEVFSKPIDLDEEIKKNETPTKVL